MEQPTWLHIGRLGLLGCGTVPTSLPNSNLSESCRYELSAWIRRTNRIYRARMRPLLTIVHTVAQCTSKTCQDGLRLPLQQYKNTPDQFIRYFHWIHPRRPDWTTNWLHLNNCEIFTGSLTFVWLHSIQRWKIVLQYFSMSKVWPYLGKVFVFHLQ